MTIARLRSHGHPAVRATHRSSFELVADADLTERGTCIIGVRTELVDGSLDDLVGPVTIELEVAGRTVSVDAIANPERAGDGGLVVRRGRARLPDTLATHATVGAAGLDRSWVGLLADPDAVLDVAIRRRPRRADQRPHLVLGRATDAEHARVAAEIGVADAVVAEERRLTGRARRADEAAAVLAGGGRVLVLGSGELAGGPVPDLVASLADVALESFGRSPTFAVAAAVGGPAPLEVVGRVDDSDGVQRMLHAMGDGRRVVGDVRDVTLPKLLRDVPDAAVVAMLLGPSDADSELARYTGMAGLERARAARTGRTVVTVGVALADRGRGDGSGPRVEPPGLVAALLAAGVSRTTITRALADQPGWSRNAAYDAALDG